MEGAIRAHNPILHRETAKAFAQMQLPDFSHVQDWALVQAFAPLFKTSRLPLYWLRDIQRLMRFEHSYLGMTDSLVTLHQTVPQSWGNRTVLMLTQGLTKKFVLFTQPSPLTLKTEPIFREISCPVYLYLVEEVDVNSSKPTRP